MKSKLFIAVIGLLCVLITGCATDETNHSESNVAAMTFDQSIQNSLTDSLSSVS
jgi:hypothetical protein